MKTVSDSFSIPRFGEVMKKYLAENGRTLLMGALMIVGVMILWEAILAFTSLDYYTVEQWDQRREINGLVIDPSWSFVREWVFAFLFLFGAVSASFTGSGLGTKENRLAAIMLPAHQLEKYLVRWTLYVLGFIVVFIAAVIVGEFVRIGIITAFAEDAGLASLISPYYIFTFLPTHEVTFNSLLPYCIFIAVQAVFTLGSFLWPKASVIKTFAAALITLWVFVGIVFLTIFIVMKPDYSPYTPSELTVHTVFYTVTAVVTIFCYVLSYYRFKEMEVVNRW